MKNKKSVEDFLTDVFGQDEDIRERMDGFYEALTGWVYAEFQETFDVMEHEGGGEGGSEDVTTVIKIISGEHAGKFYRFNFSYFSYEGYDFDDIEIVQVEPRDVMRVEFVPI